MHYAVSAIGRDRPGIVAAVTGLLLELGANIEDSRMSILRGHFAMMLVVSLPDDPPSAASGSGTPVPESLEPGKSAPQSHEGLPEGATAAEGAEAAGGDPLSRLREDLEAVRAELGLEAVSAAPIADLEHPGPQPSHILTLYGADHPGIVHAVSSALAERGISITGLETKLAGAAEQPLYVMSLEIAAGSTGAGAAGAQAAGSTAPSAQAAGADTAGTQAAGAGAPDLDALRASLEAVAAEAGLELSLRELEDTAL